MSSTTKPASPAPNKIKRRPLVAELLKHRGNTLVVPGLGSPTWDISAAGDSADASRAASGQRGDRPVRTAR